MSKTELKIVETEFMKCLKEKTQEYKDIKIKIKQELKESKISCFQDMINIYYDLYGLLDNYTDFEKEILLKDLENIIKNKYYNTEIYKNNIFLQEQEDNLLENPPEVREGEVECQKCKQKKTVIIEMQTRSCDEGFTYQICCFNPKCRYVKTTSNF